MNKKTNRVHDGILFIFDLKRDFFPKTIDKQEKSFRGKEDSVSIHKKILRCYLFA